MTPAAPPAPGDIVAQASAPASTGGVSPPESSFGRSSQRDAAETRSRDGCATAANAGDYSVAITAWRLQRGGRFAITIDLPTTNVEEPVSLVLSDGATSKYSSGSPVEYKRNFDHITALQFGVQADHWLQYYDLNQTNAFYISNIRFVRMVPASPAFPRSVSSGAGILGR